MNHRTFFAALLAGTALASPALSADLYTKAPPAAVAPAYLDEWSGIYVGLEAGYGWGKQDIAASSIGGFGGAGNIANILNSVGNGVLFPEFTGLGIGNSMSPNGGLFGGFAGAQKQLGNWVFGLEVDFDGSWIKGASAASAVQNGVTVSNFQFGFPTVLSVTDPGQTITVPGQTVTSTGTATVVPVNITIPGQTITSTGTVPAQTINIPVSAVTGVINPSTTSICPCTLTFHLPIIGNVSVPIPAINVPVNGQVNVPGQNISVTIPAQNISVTGHTVAATVTVPGQTVPLSVTGTVQPVTVGVGGITSTGTVQTPVLQQFQQVTNVTRSVSIDTKIDELGSARGKIGFTPAPNWLVYGTGGLAFAHVANNVVATESFAADIGNGLQNFSRSVSASGGATLLGWALGAGVDWKLAGTNWILGLEYLHYEFPKHTIGLNDSSASVSFVNNRESVDAVKGRISYLFPIH